MDYLEILKALDEIPFGVGKKLLTDYLRGETDNYSIRKNNLEKLNTFGSLFLSKTEINLLIKNLMNNNLITKKPLKNNKFIKVYQLTPKGKEEIEDPKHFKKKISYKYDYKNSKITKQDKMLFEQFSFFLDGYNDHQKKAIISPEKNILTIAGAGTGKTTVLTKRIEFLKQFRMSSDKEILAVTFTKRAKEEMISRIDSSLSKKVSVETFHSFCEKMLQRYNDLIYDKSFNVLSYKDKIRIVNNALSVIDLNFDRAINIYFSKRQRSYKDDEKLKNTLVNDIFFVRDYFKSKNKEIKYENFENVKEIDENKLKLVFSVSNYINSYMKKKGLRDFTDQMVDTIKLFKQHPEKIPHFSHILVDEFQDINSIQMELIKLISFDNSFFVGDPRQSIFGWRGSDVNYILNFDNFFDNPQIIMLDKNYRSNQHIINLANKVIENMNLNDLKAVREGKNQISLKKFESEKKEFEFVIDEIKENVKMGTNPSEIYVISRTNKSLKKFSNELVKQGINHIYNGNRRGDRKGIFLSTVHSVKGMEAKIVFLIGANSVNFPIKTSEHPIIDMIKVDEYDKEEEERRLLYVAMTRAKDKLYISYTSTLTYFIDDEMKKLFDEKKSRRLSVFKLIKLVRDWRKKKSKELNVEPNKIIKNESIQDLVIKRPESMIDLNKINKLSKTQIEKFGNDLLDVINE
ncbi:MAG: ATP-dependent DNA helicase UvrD2 [Candidatus Woesearchaeota archaeon]